MKIKLTPELSYLIGMWTRRRTKEGLGVEGGKEIQEIFAQKLLEQGLTTSDRLLSDENKVYFYHGKYRKFFQEIENEKLERYKYINEYSANYLAGLFDAVGGITEGGVVYLERFGGIDEMLLMRLGFPVKKMDGKMLIGRPKAFLLFIRNYTKLFANHPIMAVAGKRRRRKVSGHA
ncbi:MAG: hypothetical protein PHS02_01160 [Candidatus ainarchaeum sp.]|nr:hypothetical protein [Candidatus ainarchaeum sp.]